MLGPEVTHNECLSWSCLNMKIPWKVFTLIANSTVSWGTLLAKLLSVMLHETPGCCCSMFQAYLTKKMPFFKIKKLLRIRNYIFAPSCKIDTVDCILGTIENHVIPSINIIWNFKGFLFKVLLLFYLWYQSLLN